MHYSLDKLETIPEAARQQLAAFNIHNTDDLLNRAATPRDRERLAEKTRILSKALARWAGIADLLRVKGIGPGYAELLVKSGLVGNVQQLLSALKVNGMVWQKHTGRIAEREQVYATASELAQKLKAFAEQNSITRRPPSVRELAEAGEEAAELRPRMVLGAPDDGEGFRLYVLTRAEKSHRFLSKGLLALVGILTGAVALLFGFMLIWQNHRLDELPTDSGILDSLGIQVLRTTMNYGNQSTAIVAALILAGTAMLLIVYHVLTHLLGTRLVLCMFDSPPYRAFYRKATSINLERQKRAGWQAMAIFVVIALGLCLYFSFTMDWDVTAAEFVSRSSLPVAIGGVLLGIVVSMPVLSFYLRQLKLDPALDKAGAQRYLIFILCQIAMIPIMVTLLAQVALPGLLQVHTYVCQTYIVPRFRADIMATRAAVVELKIDDESDQLRRERMLERLDEMLIDLSDYVLVLTEEDRGVLDVAVPLGLNIVVWLAVTGAALLFVVPYFVLGGWRRGLLYMVILGAAFRIENALADSAPTWFSLKLGSGGSLLIVAFVIFANALFFDWLFETLSERKTVCPGCQAQLDESDVYCSVCGLMQP